MILAYCTCTRVRPCHLPQRGLRVLCKHGMCQTSSSDLLLVCVCVVTMLTAKEQACQHRDEPADRYDNSYVNLGEQHLDFLESY